MAGLNKVQLIGHVGRDPDVRHTQGGATVASFSLATSETWYDREDKKQERTEWHNVVCFGRLAESVGEHVKKGKQLYIEGRNQTTSWFDKEKVKHWKTEVVAKAFQFLGPKDGGSGRQPAPPVDDYDIGDLGPPLDMDDKPIGSEG